MPEFMRSFMRVLGLFSVLCLISLQSFGSHIFGVDLFYTSIGGNTYSVNLVIYGDCAGSAFYTLSSAIPAIDIYNGNTYVSTLSLAVQPPNNGIEVTPVCPAQAGNTTCTNIANPVPGIKKFVYTANVILPSASPVWRFVFAGDMGGGSTAGRSGNITNVNSPSTTNIQLVDTLNNTLGTNSSAVYSTIPTPFFCISSPANYNPGAVDPNGDILSFSLVPAIDANTGSSVSYMLPYTATVPLGTSAGTFSFNSATGQLSFTPNILQEGLVVYNVREVTAGGVLKGTSQREMTLVVLSPCTNNPPIGNISAPSAGTVVSSTQLNICSTAGLFNFQINPTDADGDSITMSVSGLPAGATFNITNNGYPAPHGTFQWNAATAAPGNYTFYINYLDHGCPIASSQSVAYVVTVLPVPAETVDVVSQATCSSRAVFHITPGGSASPWSINVLQGATILHNFSSVTGIITDSLLPGTYTIRIYNPSLCYKDTVITIAAPSLPSANIFTSPPLCTNTPTGAISVTGTVGASPFQYAIGAGAYSSSGLFSGLLPVTYTVHIKDANGCIKDTTIGVPDVAPILEHLIVTKPLCGAQANGRVIVQAYNSIAPYSYAVGSGSFSSNDTFSNLSAGTYTFHIMNGNGCIDDTTITLVDSQYLHGTIAIAGILCNGGTTTITVNGISGFGGSYTYSCNTGPFSTVNTFVLSAGSDSIHIMDGQSCSFDTAITITQPAVISVSNDIANATCYGVADGAVNIFANGGTPGYVYALDAGAFSSSPSVTGISAGTHVIHVKDANGCMYNDTVTITQPSRISYDSIILAMPLCAGYANGTIKVLASGGVPGYTYAVNAAPYSVSNAFFALSAGIYTLHVKDANGCVRDSVVTLSQPAPVTAIASSVPSLCQTLSNGQVMLSASGGTPGYTYAMGVGSYSTSGNFAPLAAGSYVFHIRDANGCTKDTFITITNTLHIAGTFTVTPANCYGDANGVISVTGINGTSPYTYAMGSGAFSAANTFNGLALGSYTIHVEDANGCIGDSLVAITQPANLVTFLVITPPSCFGLANGAVTLNITGGTAPYTFSINGGAYGPSPIFNGLSAATYTVSVKDAHGCIHDTTFVMSEPAKLIITNITKTDISCNGGGNGTVIVTGSGGTPVYHYAANSAAYQLSNILTGLPSGAQVIHLQDSHGCTVDSTVVLSQPAPFAILGTVVINPTCEGFTNGTVVLYPGGGTPAYRYSKDNVNFSGSPVFSGLTEGTYTFYMTDANNCTSDTTITLTGYPHIHIDSVILTKPTCTGNNDGGASIYATGGVQPLAYYLNGTYLQVAPNVFTNMSFGLYTVIVKDDKGCVKDTTFTLPQPDTFSVSTVVTPNDCEGHDDNGAVMTVVLGGTPPYSYIWTVDSSTLPYIDHRRNGVYTVWVRDSKNCVDSQASKIEYNDCCKPFIPDAFSPNNDGKNDVFKLRYKGDVRIIEFSIFNRYGERIFLSEYSEHGWDGTYKGEPCDIGTYYYYVRLLCGNQHDNIVELTGDVTLVR